MRSEDEGWGIIAASMFFFLVGQLCFSSLPRSGNGSGDECHRCAASVADKRNGRRDCDDEYGWGMRDGK